MPYVNVKVFEDRLADVEFAGKIASAVTEAVVSVCGESARESTWVVIDGVPRGQWSFGGEFAVGGKDANGSVPGSLLP